jgi:hypothetical protein
MTYKFRRVRMDLKDRFGDQVTVTGKRVSGVMTDKFEVQVAGGGELLHSMIGGDGFVDTAEKKNKIIKGVEEAIASTK